MEFNVLERLLLGSLLPEKESFVNMKIVSALRNEISFSEEEHKQLNFVQEGEQMKWENAGIVKEIKIGDIGMSIFKKVLEKLDENGDITPQICALCEKLGVFDDNTKGE